MSLLVGRAEGETTADVAPEKIERVLFNLITNALRHTPSDGSVAVNVARREGEVLVSVEDTGSGIEPDALGRMFERFWRADRARSEAGNGARPRDLTGARGGPRRPDLGRESRAGRRARLVHAARPRRGLSTHGPRPCTFHA